MHPDQRFRQVKKLDPHADPPNALEKHVLSDPDRRKLRAWTEGVGAAAIAGHIGIATQTLVRALAGLEVRFGSLALIRNALLQRPSA